MEAKTLSLVLTLYMLFLHITSCCCCTKIQNIVILGGQSNMVGRGGVHNFVWDGIVPEQCHSSPQILRFNVNRTWEEATEPLHSGIDPGKINKPCGVGPAMPFANFLLNNNSAFGSIGLVPCAIGDTSMSEWSKCANDTEELYDTMLARARAAMTMSGGGALRAVLWYQGEKDTTAERAPLYKDLFQKFIMDVRADLQSPLLPFIEVALDMEAGNFTDMVRNAQLETAAEIANVKCVDARGLPLEDDVHLTTDSQVQLGTMMAKAFLQIIGED